MKICVKKEIIFHLTVKGKAFLKEDLLALALALAYSVALTVVGSHQKLTEILTLPAIFSLTNFFFHERIKLKKKITKVTFTLIL